MSATKGVGVDTKFEFTTLYKNTREGRLSLIIPANHLHSVMQLITELVPRLFVLLKAHPARIIRSHVKWAHSQWHFVGILPNSDIRNDIARKTIPALFQRSHFLRTQHARRTTPRTATHFDCFPTKETVILGSRETKEQTR